MRLQRFKITAITIAAVILWFFARLFRVSLFKSSAAPAATFAIAKSRIDVLIARDQSFADLSCHSRFLCHDHPTKKVYVFFHGYTNCPLQFERLGEVLFNQGNTVLIPRMPYHGFSNIMSTEHAHLTAGELTSWADSVLDIAAALGDQIVVAGISAGGVLSAWAATQRKDVSHVICMSPAFGFAGYPVFITRGLLGLIRIIPNQFKWWNPELKGKRVAPPHVYPRYATKTLGEFLTLSLSVRRSVSQKNVSPCPITFVTNENDEAISNNAIFSMAKLWKKTNVAPVHEHNFPAHLELAHDFIDPSHPKQKVDLVYPALLELLEGNLVEKKVCLQ